LQRRLGRAMSEIKCLVEDNGVVPFDVIKQRIMEGE
jgi:hypothetical protein